MKRRKNKALKKKVCTLTRRVGRQKIFQLPDLIKRGVGYLFIGLAAIFFMFPLYALAWLAIGLLFLRGPMYTERKILRIIHACRRIRKKVYKYIKHLPYTS